MEIHGFSLGKMIFFHDFDDFHGEVLWSFHI